MSKSVPNIKRPSAKPEAVTKERMNKRVKKNYKAKSCGPKNKLPKFKNTSKANSAESKSKH